MGTPSIATEPGSYLAELFAHRQINPVVDKKTIEQRKGGLLPQSYQWILSSSDFNRWRNEKDAQLLWITGDPGKGKTMLLCGIIDELNKDIESSRSRNLAYFFCLDERRDDSLAVVRGLLRTLFAQQPALRKSYEANFNGQPSLNVNNWADLAHLAKALLQDDQLQDTYIVIDALDECRQGLSDLLNLISRTPFLRVKFLLSSRSSDHIDQVLQVGTAPGRQHLSLELNSDSILTAVNCYIEHLTQGYDAAIREDAKRYLKNNAGNTFLWVSLVTQELAKDAMSCKSNCFLDRLRTFPAGLEMLYQRIWDNMLGDMSENDGTGPRISLGCRLLALALTVQRPVTLTELTSLMNWPPGFPTDDWTRRELVGYCRSFLTVDQGEEDEILHLVHKSAKDFLLKNAAGMLFPSGIASHHWAVATCSLQAMARTLRKGMHSPKAENVSKIEASIKKPLGVVGYSCLHWVDHLELGMESEIGHPEALGDDGLVHSFLITHLLHWFEAIGRLKAAGIGITAILKLVSLIRTAQHDKNAPQREVNSQESAWQRLRTGISRLVSIAEDPSAEESKVLRLATDGFRTLRRYGGIVEHNPLQVYASLLLFNPLSSAVRQVYLKGFDDDLEWVAMSRPVARDWTSRIHVLQTGSFGATVIVLSPDGTLLVTVPRSKDAIKVWDTITGGCRITLKADLHDNGVPAFSPCGNILAAVLCDGSTALWDVTTGEMLQHFDPSSDDPRMAVFSSENSSLLLLSPDGGGVSTFNAISGQRMSRTILEHKPRNQDAQSQSKADIKLISSKDLVVMATSEPALLLYNLQTGRCERHWPPQELCVPVGLPAALPHERASISVSPDEKHISFICSGKATAVMVLDIQTRQLWPVPIGLGPRESRRCVTLAVGGWLLSWDHDSTFDVSSGENLEVWNVKSKRRARTLQGHLQGVTSVCAHPKRAFAASCSGDRTIRLWDLTKGQCIAVYRGHKTPPRRVVFSLGGSIMASSTDEGHVKLWDVVQGNPGKEELRAATQRYVSHVVFSPNRKQVATRSVSWDEGWPLTDSRPLIDVWDLATGIGRRIESAKYFELEFSLHRSRGPRSTLQMAFSPDGEYIAHGDHETYVVYVESLRTGRPNLPLLIQGHEPKQLRYAELPQLQFSQDGKSIMAQEYCGDIFKRSQNGQENFDARGKPFGFDFSSDGEPISVFSIDLRFAAHAYKAADSLDCLDVWDTVSRDSWTYKEVGAAVRSMAFSPTGQLLALAVHSQVQVWDVLDRRCQSVLSRKRSDIREAAVKISSVAFSHDGESVVSSSEDRMLRVWDLSTSRCKFQVASRHMAEYFVNGQLINPVNISRLEGAVMLDKPEPGLDPFFGLVQQPPYNFVTRNGKDVLWLPSEYVPIRWAVQDSSMIICCRDGQILILRFNKDDSTYPEDRRLRPPFRLASTWDGIQEVLFGDTCRPDDSLRDFEPGYCGN